MAAPLTVTLPPNLELWGGCILRVTALDASTGNTVADVNVSSVTFQVDSQHPSELEYGPFMLVTGPGG